MRQLSQIKALKLRALSIQSFPLGRTLRDMRNWFSEKYYRSRLYIAVGFGAALFIALILLAMALGNAVVLYFVYHFYL